MNTFCEFVPWCTTLLFTLLFLYRNTKIEIAAHCTVIIFAQESCFSIGGFFFFYYISGKAENIIYIFIIIVLYDSDQSCIPMNDTFIFICRKCTFTHFTNCLLFILITSRPFKIGFTCIMKIRQNSQMSGFNVFFFFVKTTKSCVVLKL